MMDRQVPHFSFTMQSTRRKKTRNTGRITGWLLLFLVIMLVIPPTAQSGESTHSLSNTITTGRNVQSSFPPGIPKEIEEEISADKSTEAVVEKHHHLRLVRK